MSKNTSKASVKRERTDLTIEDIPGVGPAIAQKLRDADYSTIESIAVATTTEISSSIDIGEKTAAKIINAARKMLKIEFISAKELLERRQREVKYITTGSEELDKMLGGGIETRTITELFGEYATGKTQICHQLSVNVQLPEERGGLEKGVVYIDTENTFRPERIVQIAESMGLDSREVLENIVFGRAYSSEHLIFLIKKIDEIMKEKNIGLIVIDSVISHFRSEYPGRESLVTRQQSLNKHLHDLLRVSDIYDCAVVVTNQVIARPDVFYGNPMIPAGGHILGHMCTARIYLRKGRENVRIARLVDSPHLPEQEAHFKITEEGIRDL